MSTSNHGRSSREIRHDGEDRSNDIRHQIWSNEPVALRTFTPSMAVLASSAGSYHFTPEGRKLADFTSGVLVANLGHHPKQWWQLVLNYLGLQLDHTENEYARAIPLTSYNAVTEVESLAVTRLLENMRAQPGGSRMEKVTWSASGSEGVQKALWAALCRREGTDLILATRHGFHGKKGLAGAVTGSEQDPERDPRVRFISFPRDECCSLQERYQPIDLAPYERELSVISNAHADDICCVITEPYLGGGGSYHPQPAYLQLLQDFCRRHDILFILDEVQSNFGRTGSMYAYTTYGIEPDIVILGKGMGNGIPVNAVVGRADVFDNLAYGEASDTWSGHALGCAATLATLDVFESEDIVVRSAELAREIEAGLMRLTELELVAHVRGEGTVWGIEFAALGSRSAKDMANAAVRACYLGDNHGHAIHLLGPLAGKVIRIAPPLTMPAGEAAEYLDAMYNILDGIPR